MTLQNVSWNMSCARRVWTINVGIKASALVCTLVPSLVDRDIQYIF